MLPLLVHGNVEKYDVWQRRRLSMKPGLTCIWQTSPKRNEVSFEEWMKMDLSYIDNWSLGLDFKILFKTVFVVLMGAGPSTIFQSYGVNGAPRCGIFDRRRLTQIKYLTPRYHLPACPDISTGSYGAGADCTDYAEIRHPSTIFRHRPGRSTGSYHSEMRPSTIFRTYPG